MKLDQVKGVPLRWRSRLALLLVSSVGIVAFGWPLLAEPGSGLAHGNDGPWLFALLLPLLLLVVLTEIADGGMDVKAVALLGVLSAVGAALRPLGGGATGFQPMFVVLILGGRVLGPGFGFVLGAVSMFASALLTAGIGPWLPFQMLGGAWVAFFAGCLPQWRGRRELLLLSGYGFVAGIAYGFLLNLWFWPFLTDLDNALSYVPGAPLVENLKHAIAFSLVTSLGWDLPRAVGNAVLVLLVGRPVLAALRRAIRRAAFEAPVVFQPVPAPTPMEVR